MKFNLPVYCEKQSGDKGDVFYVRTLFATGLEASRPELKRASDSLTAIVQKGLRRCVSEARHEDVANLAFSPELHEQAVTVHLELRRRTFDVRFLFAIFEAAGRRIAYTPRLPALAFELGRKEDLATRAAEVFTAYYRKLEREDKPFDAANDGIKGSAWLSTLDFNLDVDASWNPAPEERRAEIGGFANMNGAAELQRVGRLVNALYPDDLGRAIRRDDEVSELARLLGEKASRPVVVRGRSGVGKTAIIHETVRRMMEARGKGSERNQVWLVSPQRLISGMMFVGQWENRLHAILAECRRRSHVLYFDDLVGLFRAGISASSKVSVAAVLKPHLERREVRVLAECTPEAFRVLTELDRSFADLFHVLPLEQPNEAETLRILIHQQRELESRLECRFDLEALPTTLDLSTRYRREQAFPGKAAGFLSQLAVKHRKEPVTRRDVLAEFQARSGLAVTFLDEHARLSRDDIRQGLRSRIVGQDGAVEAMCDAISIAKARLNDPDKPLGSLLFLGPTGVGKTECAKALAEFLYGSAERLLRFDMNEYPEAHSVARLAGTIHEPEGLLTGAVRRQPFSVILLDEIEKAHPAAFDLLLQVLGEGRLTDALGRTADFSNCIIVLTSNLGAREAEGGMGLAGHDSRGDDAYVQAARRFFRPEFFNRLDHIVPFSRLSREQVGEISRHLLHDVLTREGLQRRRCILQVDPLAMERVVDRGFHPTLGARAIRREIERQLTLPLAARLAELKPDVPVLVSLMARGDEIAVATSPLHADAYAADAAARLADLPPDDAIAVIDKLLNAAETQLEALKPQGAISGGDVNPALQRYYAIKAQVEAIDRAVESYLDWRERGSGRPQPQQDFVPVDAAAWLELHTPADARTLLAGAAEVAGLEGRSRMLRLGASAALLTLMLKTEARDDERALLLVDAMGGVSSRGALLGSLMAMLRMRFELGADFTVPEGSDEVVVSGYLAQPLTQALAGTYLHVSDHGLTPLRVLAAEVPRGDDAKQHAARLQSERRAWAQAVARGEASPDHDPVPARPVRQVLVANGPTLDVRGGMLSRERPTLALLAQWLLCGLPLEGAP
ncbi:MAG: ATP-dependent Clp protease ATP-binding subunit [Planctomycetes bacterium]|nr:ATP-dependent Clp protease ATP-binding subunit [Planctomycetota bacterium]